MCDGNVVFVARSHIDTSVESSALVLFLSVSVLCAAELEYIEWVQLPLHCSQEKMARVEFGQDHTRFNALLEIEVHACGLC